jgi:hypothetical protein
MAARGEADYLDLFYGTDIRRMHSDNFLVGFDRLVKLAKECDTNNIILDSLVFSAHGMLNMRMRELHPTIKFKPINVTNTQKYMETMEKQLGDQLPQQD